MREREAAGAQVHQREKSRVEASKQTSTSCGERESEREKRGRKEAFPFLSLSLGIRGHAPLFPSLPVSFLFARVLTLSRRKREREREMGEEPDREVRPGSLSFLSLSLTSSLTACTRSLLSPLCSTAASDLASVPVPFSPFLPLSLPPFTGLQLSTRRPLTAR